jgi:hypothetical protein
MSTETLPLAASTLASRLPGRLDNSAARKLGVALVAVTTFAIWLLSGVTLATVVRFVAFECLFVVMPGCVLVALLCREHAGWYRTVAIGWPLGYVLAIGAYALLAAIHARQLFVLLPVLVVSTAVVRVLLDRAHHRAWRWNPIGSRHSFPTDERDRRIALLTTALVVSIALVFLAFSLFVIYPLPERASSVTYYPDTVLDISLAAEARHHWPITEPSVAGRPLHYYTGVFIYAAAVNQVTGIPLASIFLRLLPPVIMILVSLQLMLLAGRRRESIWVGSIAVILFLLVSEVNLDATRFDISGSILTNSILVSPTYGLGIPLFLALLVIMRRQLVGDGDDDARSSVITRQQRVGAGLVVTALLLGLGATKTTAAIDLLGGLALYSIWRYVTSGPERVLSAYLALSAAAVTIIYFTMLAGGTASTLHLGPFQFLRYTIFAHTLRSPLIARLVAVPAAVVASCFFLCAPLFAAGWLLRRRGDDVPMAGLLLSIFVCSLCAYLLLEAPGGSQGYFMVYGYIAMLPLAATGLTRLWSELGQSGRRRMGWACFVTLILGLALAASSQLTATFAGSGPTGSVGYDLGWLAWYAVVYGLVAGTLLRMSIGLESSLAPAVRRRAVRIAACSIPLLSTLGAVKVLGGAGPGIANTILQRRSVEVDSASNRGMTAALYRGLVWVRDHTSPCAVLAVNNHYSDAAMNVSSYVYYSAFTERNVYLESWGDTFNVLGGQRNPFPRRLALNDAATIAGSAVALRGLQREGVSYILIDKTHGPDPREPADLARLVFQNSALDVYLIAPRTGSEPAACAA